MLRQVGRFIARHPRLVWLVLLIVLIAAEAGLVLCAMAASGVLRELIIGCAAILGFILLIMLLVTAVGTLHFIIGDTDGRDMGGGGGAPLPGSGVGLGGF